MEKGNDCGNEYYKKFVNSIDVDSVKKNDGLIKLIDSLIANKKIEDLNNEELIQICEKVIFRL